MTEDQLILIRLLSRSERMDVPKAENRAAGAGDALGWIVDRRTRLPPAEE